MPVWRELCETDRGAGRGKRSAELLAHTGGVGRFSAIPAMITSGLVVDGVVGHGLQAHLPYNHQAVAAAVHNHHRMSYVEPSAYLKSVVPPPPSPQLQQQQQQQQQQSSEPPATPEFLRPLPKPAPVNPLKAPRASSKYAVVPQPPPPAECRPVNLTATKDQQLPPPPPPPSVQEHHLRLDDRHHPYPVYGHPRLYVSASPYHHHPYPMHQPAAPYGVYTSPYAPVIPRDTRHHQLMQPPPPQQQQQQQQDRRYPSPPNKNGCAVGVGVGIVGSPSSSPPEPFKVPNGRDNKAQLQQHQPQQRILPPPNSTFAALAVNNNNNNIVVAAAEPSPKKARRCLQPATPEPQSPPAISAAKTSNFTKGSLIRLANGNIKKVEDMRTEDFLNSVENSDLHRIDPSTVVRIEDHPVARGIMKITLSYGDQRNHQINGGDNNNKKPSAAAAAAACKSHQAEMESGAEHPYFVFGRGWASCSPAKTLAKYGLTCQRLQVGDVCVSLSKRPTAAADSTTAPIITPPQGGGGKRRQQQQQHPPPSMAVHLQQPHTNNNHNNHQQQQQQQLLLQQHHYHHNNNNNNNNINNNNNHHHHPTAVQKAQLQLHHHHHQQQQQQQQQQQHLLHQQQLDEEKIARNKRRWSAPDPDPTT